uniref:hypothetical protein n=1 Tax=Paraglaciecola marina TaxID=2500157 RepID=UPI00197E491E
GVMYKLSMNITRKKVCFYWLLVGTFSSVLASTISMLYWHFTYMPEPNVNWSPINDMLGMFMIMPFGWLMSIITPAGWLSVIGLGLALYKISLKPLILSVLGSLLFGIYWPKFFVGMMGI